MDLIERDRALEIIEESRKRYKFEDWETAVLEWIGDEIWVLPSVGWIPVTERLPEEDGEYIATTIFLDEPNISILRYESGRHFYVHDRVFGDIRVKDDEVLAWMPLPEPYKEKKE